MSASLATVMSSSPSPSPSFLSIFYPTHSFSTRSLVRLPFASSKGNDNDFDLRSNSSEMNIVPVGDTQRGLSLSPLSKDVAMGLVLNAAAGKGWTTGSGMEGPSEPLGDAESTSARISTFPWSLFTKSPRRRMLVAFTCKICSQRTTRAINPHAYTEGTVFVQCCGCNAYHKLVDNLNLFQDMKCYIDPSFRYQDERGHVNFEYQDMEDGEDNIFGV